MNKKVLNCVLFFLISMAAYSSTGRESFVSSISEADKWALNDLFNELKSSGGDKYFQLMESIFQSPEDYVLLANAGIAKIHSADILVQGYRNRRYENEALLETIYNHAKESTRSETSTIAQNAIFIVGYFDRDDGFSLLMEVLKNGDRMTASASALAASSMCNSFNVDEFEDAVSKIPISLRDKIKEQGYQHREALLSGSWCNQQQLP